MVFVGKNLIWLMVMTALLYMLGDGQGSRALDGLTPQLPWRLCPGCVAVEHWGTNLVLREVVVEVARQEALP